MVRRWSIDLTSHLRPGQQAELRYEPGPYDVSNAPEKSTESQVREASQIVRASLILYRAPGARLDAPTLRVADVGARSNAAKAGMKAVDYLAADDGTPVTTRDAVRAEVERAQAAGKTRVAVTVHRGEERLEVVLEPGTMGIPSSSERP